jgi:hypothetical protein
LAGIVLKNAEREMFIENKSMWRRAVEGLCWCSYYPHSELAVVDCWDRREREVNTIVAGAIKDVARSTWVWWPFEYGAVLCDRPTGHWWTSISG